MRGKLLYELRPDLFPQRMTDVERELWELFYEEQKNNKSKQ
jgi:hypothetical protein